MFPTFHHITKMLWLFYPFLHLCPLICKAFGEILSKKNRWQFFVFIFPVLETDFKRGQVFKLRLHIERGKTCLWMLFSPLFNFKDILNLFFVVQSTGRASDLWGLARWAVIVTRYLTKRRSYQKKNCKDLCYLQWRTGNKFCQHNLLRTTGLISSSSY